MYKVVKAFRRSARTQNVPPLPYTSFTGISTAVSSQSLTIMHASLLCNFFLSSPSISQRRSRRLYKPGQGRPGGPHNVARCVRNCRCTIISRIASLPLPPPESFRAASTSSACTGLGHSCLLVQRTFRQHTHCRLLHYALLTLLRTIRSPYAMSSTGSLSFLTPLSFYFILQHYCTKSFPRFPHQFICGPSAASIAPLLFPVSSRLLSFQPFQPFRSVSSVLHHLPSPHTTVVSSPHEPEGLLIVTRIPYCPTLRSSIPINPILSERHLHSGPLAFLCESTRSRAHRRQPQLPEWLRPILPAASCGEMMCAGQRSGDPSPVIESFHVTR